MAHYPGASLLSSLLANPLSSLPSTLLLLAQKSSNLTTSPPGQRAIQNL
jgi:hypothetical protein